MAWWVWLILGLCTVGFAVDWLIVMGTNPRKWKGGNKD